MNETIDDIVAEMREYESEPPPRDAWLDLADRIEAAYKCEQSQSKTAIGYDYVIQTNFNGVWNTTTNGMKSLDEAKEHLQFLYRLTGVKRRIVRRQFVEFEEVKE